MAASSLAPILWRPAIAKLYNLARVTTATSGTGTITLGSAVAGFLSFAGAGVADGETVTYAIKDGSNSEIGRGVYTSSGTTLTRSVLKSTNSNNAISLSGSAVVFITASAEDFNKLNNTLGAYTVGLAAGTNVTADRTLTITTGDANRTLDISEGSATISAYGSTLIDDTSASAARATLEVMARNRLINGCMRINQRGAASNADDTYALDRWNVLTQTGTVAVTRVSDVEDSTPHIMRITQSQASAQRFGVEQIIESVNCRDLRGQSATLSARVRCSASTTLRYAIIEWTGTSNTVTSDVVLDWTSGTFTAGNFFTSTSTTITATGSTALTANTFATVSLTGTVGSSMNNLIVFFWTDSTQAQNVTLDVGKVQLEQGAAATPFERVGYDLEFVRCQRYFEKIGFDADTAPANGTSGFFTFGQAWATGSASCGYKLAATKRNTSYSVTFYNGTNKTASDGTWSILITSWSDATTTTLERQTIYDITVTMAKTGHYTVSGCYGFNGGAAIDNEL